jgi:hypothetical protein
MIALLLLLAASIAPFTITISTSHSVVTAKSPIEVQVALKNTSNRDLRIFVDNSDKAELSGFDVEVTDPQGLAPKITAYHNVLTGWKAPPETVMKQGGEFIIVGSGGTLPLAPGETIDLHMDIGQMYDLSKPGTYTVQVTRTDAPDGTMVKSNPLKITVTE